jgi:K+-transporting ATPase ATPase C chain
MLVHLRRSVILAIVALVATFIYAFAGTGVAQLFFNHQADGSLTANGSTLIGQNWSATKCPGHPLGSCVFQGRPDDLGPYSNTEKNNPSPAGHPGDDPFNPTPDLVTTSGSGYDPDISQQDALVQIPMVAKATGLSRSVLTHLISQQTQGTQLGFLGTSYINVLQLNEALVKLEK